MRSASGGIAILAFAGSVVLSSEGNAQPKPDPHAGHEGGALTYSGSGETRSASVLGARLGGAEVQGVQADVYVLQATSPDRLGPDGKGPTHLFNVRFVDTAASELLKDVKGVVTVVPASGGDPLRVPFVPFAKHFQSAVRLEAPGEYAIGLEFEAGTRKGSVASLPFVYRRKEAASADDPHAHHPH